MKGNNKIKIISNRQKSIVLVICVVIIFSFIPQISDSKLMVEYEKKVQYNRNIRNLASEIDYSPYNTQIDTSMILKALLYDNNMSFELRTYLANMAPLLGITGEKDYNLLLIAFEIAKTYDAKVLEGEEILLIIKESD